MKANTTAEDVALVEKHFPALKAEGMIRQPKTEQEEME